ncbi:MAG: MBOAT family protein [Chloroflexi bacterium]|nr:MBOAT family protein [Chloroflexota bacterium]
MNFVSVEFFLLFITVLILLALWRNPIVRKIIILCASCVFYAYWDWRFLSLLIIVTLMDYYISVKIHSLNDQRLKRNWLIVSIVINLTILGYFKYFNFFIDTFNVLLKSQGWMLHEFNIILPVGISFYIFETISYVMDVYKGNAQPANSLLDYAVFVTFFPRLVAGPIMRASQFLPQLYRGLQFSRENFFIGAQLFVQGLIKKIVVADSVAFLVDSVYGNPALFSSSTVYLAVFSYSIQIYFDFSGYSDMACGVAKILGFDLAVNFNFPYISQSITELWRRWHISLSSWLRDYLYFSLGGNRTGRLRTYVNLMVTMLLGGLWHGASWNFVLWGGLHGAYLVFERFFRNRTQSSQPSINAPYSWFKSLFVFFIVSITWIFFRSPSFYVTKVVFYKILFVDPSGVSWLYFPAVLSSIVVVFGGLLINTFKISFEKITTISPFSVAFLFSEYVFVLLFFSTNISPFIYFQF